MLSIKNSLLISLMRDDNRRLRDAIDVCISSISSVWGSDLVINEVDGVSIPSMSFLSPVWIIIDGGGEMKCVFVCLFVFLRRNTHPIEMGIVGLFKWIEENMAEV